MISSQTKKILNFLKKIGKKYNLDLFILFGSRAKGKEREDSDIDLAFMKKNISEKKEEALKEELIELLKDTPFNLINIEKPCMPELIYEIFNSGICIYSKSPNLFKESKLNSYFDLIDAKELLYKTRDKFLTN